ncbi:hypothetical protein IKQ21_01070 [bacterium]|nr:hypothetical protein [bacterium]
MSTYSFRATKGKYQLSLTTTDKDAVVDQFARWVSSASDYAQKQKIREGKNRVESQIKEEHKITQKKIDEQLKRMPKPEPVEETPVKDIPSKEDFEKHQETEKNLDVFYAPSGNQTPPIQKSEPANFENILDNSMNNPQTELSFKPNPTIKKDNAFLNYMSGKKVEKRIDYLLLTAYYFTQYEQKPRFTLKQLNAKLMQNMAIILDHAVIQEGINRDYIECLPDLTGVVGASEYRLTAYGEKTLFEQ